MLSLSIRSHTKLKLGGTPLHQSFRETEGRQGVFGPNEHSTRGRSVHPSPFHDVERAASDHVMRKASGILEVLLRIVSLL